MMTEPAASTIRISSCGADGTAMAAIVLTDGWWMEIALGTLEEHTFGSLQII